MCTIMTISRDFFFQHRTEVLRRLQRDAVFNAHGASMIMVGPDAADTLLLRTMNSDTLIDALDDQFARGAHERAWIHLRYATTGYTGINGAHGFAAGDWTIMHNGILQRADAARHRVDSEVIAEDVERGGVEFAIARLGGEAYANVFFIDNQTGQYHVVRMSTGTLFTDGAGNFSTEMCGAIDQHVPVNTQWNYEEKIVQPKVTEWDPWSSKWHAAAGESAAYDETIADQIDCLRYIETQDDFLDMAEAEGWIVTGIPDEVYDAMNDMQLGWATLLGLTFKTHNRAAVGE